MTDSQEGPKVSEMLHCRYPGPTAGVAGVGTTGGRVEGARLVTVLPPGVVVDVLGGASQRVVL